MTKEAAARMDEMVQRLSEEELAENAIRRLCINCGKPVTDVARGRRRKFCSDRCRYIWKWEHPNVRNWKAKRIAVCPQCGKKFIAIKEYGRVRKYCSRSCANKARGKGANDGHNGNEGDNRNDGNEISETIS